MYSCVCMYKCMYKCMYVCMYVCKTFSQPLPCPSYLDALLRLPFLRFAPEFNVSMLKKTIALVRDYVYETRK